MANREYFPEGQIIKGDFCDQYVYRWDKNSWGVCPGPKLVDGWLNGKLYWHNADYSQSGNWTGPKDEDRISESTVDQYEEIGSQQSGPNALAMLKGSLIGGIGLGLIAGAASTSATSDVAIHLKNGRSFVIRFTDTRCWIELKSMLYTLDQSGTKNEEKTPPKSAPQTQQKTLPPPDSFETVKKFKELLDMGIISQEEFEEKKKELLNSGSVNNSPSSSSIKDEETVVTAASEKEKNDSHAPAKIKTSYWDNYVRVCQGCGNAILNISESKCSKCKSTILLQTSVTFKEWEKLSRYARNEVIYKVRMQEKANQ